MNFWAHYNWKMWVIVDNILILQILISRQESIISHKITIVVVSNRLQYEFDIFIQYAKVIL